MKVGYVIFLGNQCFGSSIFSIDADPYTDTVSGSKSLQHQKLKKEIHIFFIKKY